MPETARYGTALEGPTGDPGSAGSDAAAPSDGTTSAESAIASGIINEEAALSPIARAESTRSYFLAQTLGSTRTVPVVSAKLSIEGDGTDEVVGSFIYRGITYAVEPGGESVAIVAADHAKLPQDFLEAQTIVLPSVVSPDGIDSYSVTRIADGAFSSLTQDAAFAAQSDRGPSASFDEQARDSAGSHEDDPGSDASSEGSDAADDDGSDADVAERHASDPNGSDHAFSDAAFDDHADAATDAGASSDAIDADASESASEEGPSLGIVAITIPASITSIEDDAFAGFETLRYVIVSDDNPNYSMHDGCLYDKPLSSLLLIPEGRLGAVRVAPSAVTIPEDVVSHCAHITSLIAELDSAAFSTLEDVDIRNADGESVGLAADALVIPFFATYEPVLFAEVGDALNLLDGKGTGSEEDVTAECVLSNDGLEMRSDGTFTIRRGTGDIAFISMSDFSIRITAFTVVAPAVSESAGDAVSDDPADVIEMGRFTTTESRDALEDDAQNEGAIENDSSMHEEGVAEIEDAEDGVDSSAVSFEADFMVDGVPIIKRTVSLSTGEIAEYYSGAATSTAEASPTYGYVYDNKSIQFASSKSTTWHFICTSDNSGFSGRASWTAPDWTEEPYKSMDETALVDQKAKLVTGPLYGSVVTVEVSDGGYVPALGIGTEEQFAAGGIRYWGASNEKRIIGFRNSDTGAMITPETLYSGRSFSFSYKMTVDPTVNSKVYVKPSGIRWYQTLSHFEPVYESRSDTVAIYFDSNGGAFKNAVTGHLDSNSSAVVYSTIGQALQTPQSSLEKTVNGKRQVFLGWTKTLNGSDIIDMIAPARLPDIDGEPQYAVYHAKWGEAVNSAPVEYVDKGLRIATSRSSTYHFICTNNDSGFTGRVSWTAPDWTQAPYVDMTATDLAQKKNQVLKEPIFGSVVTVEVDDGGYVPALGIGSKEQFTEGGIRQWGASNENRIIGFRNIDTGAMITPDTLYSGKAFSFSYKMTRNPSANVRVDSTGVWWRDVQGPFEPLYESSDDSVAVYFNPNGGGFRNPVTGLLDTEAPAVVYSTVGGVLETPQSPIEKIVNGKKQVFLGWTKTMNGDDIAEKEAPQRLPDDDGAPQYTTYYAKWAEAASPSCIEFVDRSIQFATSKSTKWHFICTNDNSGFTGRASWTAPDWTEAPYSTMTAAQLAEAKSKVSVGPILGSVVMVEVDNGGYIPALGIGTEEQFAAGGVTFWGATDADRIVGFRNSDTGALITPETLYSGKAFSFSYKMTVDPTANALVYVKSTGIRWHSTLSHFEPVYETASDSVAVYFHPNGGGFKNPVTGHVDSSAVAAVYSTVGKTLQTPQSPIEKAGQVFMGWTTTQNGSELAPEMAPARLPDDEAGNHRYTTYYALWLSTDASTYYYAAYDPNTAAGSTEVLGSTGRSIMQVASNSDLSMNGYSRHGYEFKEWNTRADGSGASFAQGASVSAGQLAASGGSVVSLYAVWEPLDTVVKWESNGGDAVGQATLKFDQPLSAEYATLPSVAKPGYDFGGWYATSDLSGSPISLESTVAPHGSLEITYYAKWTPTAYAITFDPNGGSLVQGSSATISYTVESDDIELPLNVTRQGYEFAKWEVSGGAAPQGGGISYSVDGKTAIVKSGTYGNFTVVASWSAHAYRMVFDLAFEDAVWKDGEAPAPGAYEAILYDAPVSFPAAPVRAGWIFQQWAPVDANTTETGFEAAQTVPAGQANFKEGQGETARFEAIWVRNLEVEVPVGSDAVSMSVTADWPQGAFVVEAAQAKLRNLSDGELKVVSVGEDLSDSDALAARRANALEMFGGQSSDEAKLEGVSLVLQPLSDAGVLFGQKAVFPLFGAALLDGTWKIAPKGESGSVLTLSYDMTFDLAKVGLIDLKAGLEEKPIASIVYAVALTDPTEPSHGVKA